VVSLGFLKNITGINPSEKLFIVEGQRTLSDPLQVIQSTHKPPVDLSTIDLKEIERLAGLRAPISAIAILCGISERSLYREKRRNPAVEAAINRGRALAVVRLGEQVEKQLVKGNTLITIFAAKQAPEHGGLGWIDERSLKQEVTLHVTPAMLAFQKSRKQIDVDVIEVDSEPIDDGD